MNEDQLKALVKKSALKTTDNFTANLMQQIEKKSTAQTQPVFPSIKRVFIIIAGVMLLLSFLLFFNNFTVISKIEIISNTHRTKLFAALLLLVLFGINYLLKIKHESKKAFNN